MMKKIATFAIIFTLAATTMLAACGNKQTTSTESTTSTTSTEASMANPMQEVDAEEMCGRVGVDLNAPKGATDIHCYIIDTGDVKIAEMTFKLGGKEYSYRATPNEMDITELSGYYFEAPTESYAEVAGREGQILTQDESSVLYWEDKVPGICYSLSSTSCDDPSVLLNIAEETFVPMQGEAGPEAEAESVNLEGNWTDRDCNTVELTAAGMGKYDVKISIVRLAELTGYGEMNGNTMNLTLEDPNGNTMKATFSYEGNNDGGDKVCKLTITDSSWDLLQTGSEFVDFVIAAG